MKTGIALPYNEARLVAKLSKMAEEADWDGVFLGDYIWCEDPMIALTAAAMTTDRIGLGTMVIPVPLRRPWKIASESVALDRLSNGRLILGLGTGAVWMGWQSFPDEASSAKARAKMLDETIDILTLLYKGRQFDYDGEHYHLRLSLMEERHYPARPVQEPRIPIWVPAIWPQKKSMQRALKCDGILPEKRGSDGKPMDLTPEDVFLIREFAMENRTENTPFDIVVSGKIKNIDSAQQKDKLLHWQEAGATWWIEGFWGESEEEVTERIRQGPIQVE